MPRMIRVRDSKAIKAVGYSRRRRRLNIRFNHGDERSKTYRFCRVPRRVFIGLLNAVSKGKYYDEFIRDKYDCLFFRNTV